MEDSSVIRADLGMIGYCHLRRNQGMDISGEWYQRKEYIVVIS